MRGRVKRGTSGARSWKHTLMCTTAAGTCSVTQGTETGAATTWRAKGDAPEGGDTSTLLADPCWHGAEQHNVVIILQLVTRF